MASGATFVEPDVSPKNGWRKIADNTWQARERTKRKPRVGRPKGFVPREPEPCPHCFAPMRGDVCSGKFQQHTREIA